METDKILLLFEMSNKRKQVVHVRGLVTQLLVHVLKIRYSKTDYYKNDWMKEIQTFRNKILKFCSDKNSTVSEMRKSGMQEAYHDILSKYNRVGNEENILPEFRDLPLPKTCPWKFDEILLDRKPLSDSEINQFITSLTSKLSDIREKKWRRYHGY